MRPAVFLDRDDTIIVNSGDLGDARGVHLAPGTAAALQSLRSAGFALIVVTNQAGVARGAFREADIPLVHHRIEALLAADLHSDAWSAPTIGPDREFSIATATVGVPLLEAFYYAPHHPEATVSEFKGEHPWRKPNPGMLLAAATRYGIDLGRSWMVGDAERDAQAGVAAGCRTVRLGEPSLRAESVADFVEQNITEATRRILLVSQQDDRPRATVLLRALAGGRLGDANLRLIVESSARAIAERAGVPLESLTISPACVRATLVGDSMAAIGFAAELRRTTERWYHDKYGGSLWGES